MSRYASVVDRLDSPAAHAWAIHDEAMRRRSNGEDIIALSVGDPDFDTPPAIVDEAVRSLRAGRTKYAPFAGEPALREAIARHHSRLTGAGAAGGEQVIVFPGAQNALFCAATCLVEAGDEVLVTNPRYVTYDAVVEATGARTVEFALDPDRDFHLDPDSLARAVTERTRMILLNSPHNPTGMVHRRDELEAVAEIAIANDLWVVVDEVYADLTYDEPYLSIAALPGLAERSVCIGSLSKSHAMQGWRLGWTIAPTGLTAHLVNLIKPMLYGMPPFVQDAALAALTGEHPEVEEMREAYRRRRDLACRRLNQIPGLRCARPEGSMFALVDVRRTGLDAEAFAYGLLDHVGVSLLPATAFGSGAAGHVRLSLTAGVEVLEDACERIAGFARTLDPELV